MVSHFRTQWLYSRSLDSAFSSGTEGSIGVTQYCASAVGSSGGGAAKPATE